MLNLRFITGYLPACLMAAALAGASPRAGAAAAPEGQAIVAAPTLSVPLQYRETELAFANRPLAVTRQTVPFRKEPQFTSRNVYRGTFVFGERQEEAVPFAWDCSGGKLHLDLNRDGDLTDDKNAVFTRSSPQLSPIFQSFPSVRLELPSSHGLHPVLLDLNLNRYNGQVSAYAGLRSFWEGKVSIGGRDWQLGLIENSNSMVGPRQPNTLLWRPWQARDQAFSLLDGSVDAFDFNSHLFLGGRAYRLEFSSEERSGKPTRTARLTEQQPELSELRLAGKDLHRVVLIGKEYTVVLDDPDPVVRVPVGAYSQSLAGVKIGKIEAVVDLGFIPFMNQPFNGITVGERGPALCLVGGPLTNSVAVHQRGRYLVLDYRLIGAGGISYKLLGQDRTKPPRFGIHLLVLVASTLYGIR